MTKATFTAERSRQFDILKQRKRPFLVWMAPQKGQVSFLSEDTSWSPVTELNWSIKEHRGMVEKLNVILKDLKEYNSTLFPSNGLASKQGEKCVHCLNVKLIKCVEAKLTKKHQNMGRKVMTSYSRAYTNRTYYARWIKEGKKKTAES